MDATRRFVVLLCALVGLALPAFGQEREPNDQKAQADVVAGLVIQARMGSTRDVDWFVLRGQEGYKPTFTITHARNVDFDFEVYSGNTRVGKALGVSSGDSRTFSVPGRCYIRVWSFRGTGPYTITIRRNPVAEKKVVKRRFASPPGIDWNAPWRNFRVQQLVRDYLSQVVLYLERTRYGQKQITHIDEWGRLLARHITATGKVDGNWENPTHYVWYAYNRYPAQLRYGLTVEQYVRRRLGGQTAPAPPAPAPAPPTPPIGIDWNAPWRNFRVQQLVRQYLSEVVLYLERTRYGQKHITHIDDWGRLLGPNITATGKVDGPWENPTHYVWSAYNRYAVQLRYGLTVEQFVRRRLGGGR